jgi:hypothetical protein
LPEPGLVLLMGSSAFAEDVSLTGNMARAKIDKID